MFSIGVAESLSFGAHQANGGCECTKDTTFFGSLSIVSNRTSLRPRSLIAFSCLYPLCLFAQQAEIPRQTPSRHIAVLNLSASDTLYKLPHEFILQGSEHVLADSIEALHRGVDYEIGYREGTIVLKPSLVSRLVSDSLHHRIVVSYYPLPFSFKHEYRLHEVVTRRDSLGVPRQVVRSSQRPFSVDDVFGPGLQKSGTIFRGFSVGSNRDLSLNSGFRMQLSGRVASDVNLVAALTDENSPIQPEGTTQTLREVDKVFVELSGSNYTATLGDFNFQRTQKEGGEFGGLSRKLQGATSLLRSANFLNTGASGSFSLIGATARGKFTTNQFQGIEGNQGPYRLMSNDGNSRPIIIAGTERVYLNGELVTRGETQDYTIDYSSGEIFFSSRRLITNASRITVDFEYSNRSFTRNLVGATVGASILSDRIRVNTMIAQEADDPDAAIDFSLDDATRALLRQSGSDQLKASIPGVRDVGRDSVTGAPKGQYLRRDTTLAGRRFSVYFYAPGDPEAVYSVTFSYVDQVPADSVGYTRTGVGRFEIAGMGKGNYLPVQLIPIPELHRVFSSTLNASVSSDLNLGAEYALSTFDRNRLSDLDDNDRQGHAFRLSARYHPDVLVIGQRNFGEIDLRVSERLLQRQFVPLDRINEIEFNRKWDLTQPPSGDEETREASLNYRPARSLSIGGSYGLMKRTGSFRSERTMVQTSLSDSALPRASYEIEHISSENIQSNDKSIWIRQRGDLGYSYSIAQPGIRIEMEKREQHFAESDSLFQGSFRFLEVAPRIGISEIGLMAASAELQIRTEDSSAAGRLSQASRSVTQLYSWQLSGWNSLSSSLSLSIRKTEFTEEFKARGNVDARTVLVRWQSRYAPAQRALDVDLLYEYASERSAQLERVFVRVPKGSGNYRYLGDTNGNGVADENEFEQTRFDGDYIVLFLPGDQVVPVADLKTGMRARFQPSRILTKPSTTLERILASLSTETVARIEEKSNETDTRQIYLLNFARFQNPSTTIAGASVFTQDLFLFENDPDLSLRFRFNQRRGLLRMVSATEMSYVRERSVRVRSQLVKEIGNQTEFINKLDQVWASSASPRERDLLSDQVRTEFSYRPDPPWEIAFGVNASRVSNRFGGRDITADVNEQFLRLTYALLGAGQLRSEVNREEVVVSNGGMSSTPQYPYEFTNGRVVGKTFLWQLGFEYRMTQYVQVTVGYNGRIEGGRTPVHTARAEARAFF